MKYKIELDDATTLVFLPHQNSFAVCEREVVEAGAIFEVAYAALKAYQDKNPAYKTEGAYHALYEQYVLATLRLRPFMAEWTNIRYGLSYN